MNRKPLLLLLVAALGGAGLLAWMWATGLERSGDWRQQTLSFRGYTNFGRLKFAVIGIHNAAPAPVYLRFVEVEFVGLAPSWKIPGLTNEHRWLPAGTNLVIQPATSADFLFLLPEQGDHWKTTLEFAPMNRRTRWVEYLWKRGYWWLKFVPDGWIGIPVHYVSQEFGRPPKHQPTLPIP